MALLTPYWGLDVIILFASLIVAAVMYATRNFKYWQKRGVLEFPPMPFVGNFAECMLMKKTPADFVKDMYDKSKGLRYMGFYIFDKPFLLIRDPELVKHVLVKDFNVFCDRYASSNVNDRLGYVNGFTIKNPAWKTLRAKITPAFTAGKLRKMFQLMTVIADDLDDYLDSQKLENGKVLEIKDLCTNFTIDLIASTGFGLQVNSIKDSNAPFRKYGKKIFGRGIVRGLEFLIIFFMPQLCKYLPVQFYGKETTVFFRTVLWEVINERIKSGQKRNDFVDLLIELYKTHEKDGDLGGFQFSGDDLVGPAAGFFTGGFETSSTAMSFSLYELALNMDVQRALRKEILQALEESGGKLTFDMVSGLPLLDMVFSETLRMYPPLGFLERVGVTDYKIPNSDLILEKGIPVYMSMTGLQYDPEYYSDPMKFNPMRFSKENAEKIRNFTYIPFGEGPHNCTGMRLGQLQTKLGLIQVLRKYEVTTCDKTLIPMVLDPKGFSAQPIGGLYLNVQKVTTEAG